MPLRDEHGKDTSRYTSIKTRIETQILAIPRLGQLHPLATLPSKQGLKRNCHHAFDLSENLPLATLPSKQGLKPRKCLPRDIVHFPSRYTSIKTRIETYISDNSRPKNRPLSLHFHQNKD